MVTFAFLTFALFLGSCVATSAPQAAAPDDGGFKPYVESFGRNAATYTTIIRNFLHDDAVANQVEPFDFLLPDWEELLPNMTSAECVGCQLGVTALRALVNILRKSYEDMRPLLLVVCQTLMTQAQRDGDVICPGVLDNYGPLVVQIVKDKKHQQEIINACTFLNMCPPPEFDDGEEPIEHSIQNEAPRDSAFLGARGAMETEGRTRRRREADVYRIVQISDVHYDPEYAVGAVKDCGMHVCCRQNYEGTGSARPWGEYTCNVPTRTVELFLRKAAELKPDMVMNTGDTPPHHLWYETLDKQLNATAWLAQALHAHLPDVPVVPTIGNHDPFPSNMYYVPNTDTKNLHEEFIAGYSVLSSDVDRQATFRTGGYFEYPLLSEPRPLRALTYNTNYGYPDNWFNLLSHYEEDDYLKMRHFVEERLAAARRDSAKIVLIGHHPVSDGIIPFDDWVTDICTRFHDVIALHVSGHKHTDSFRLFTSDINRWASSVQMVSPSSNSYTSINPSIRLYELDKTTLQLLDYEQYYMDLSATDMDASTEPNITLAYRASEEYGLTDLSPRSWHKLALSMLRDTSELNKFLYNYDTRAAARNSSCAAGDEQCSRQRVCDLVSTTLLQKMRCRRDGVKIPSDEVFPTEKATTEYFSTESVEASTQAASGLAASLACVIMTATLALLRNV